MREKRFRSGFGEPNRRGRRLFDESEMLGDDRLRRQVCELTDRHEMSARVSATALTAVAMKRPVEHPHRVVRIASDPLIENGSDIPTVGAVADDR